jgi:hypothetical protein
MYAKNNFKKRITMGNLKGKRVLIFQQRGWGINIGHFLAKKLQAEGCRLAALTLKRTTHEFVLNQKEVNYEMVINNDEIMSRPKDYLRGDTFSLKQICDELGIDSVWPIISSLRFHVRSYKDKYYYGFKQNVPDEEIIDYVMAVYKCIKEIFEKFKPEVIISPNFVALPHIMFNLFAEQQGVNMITITDSKIKSVYIFSYNYIDNKGPFFETVDALNQGRLDSKNREKAREYIKEFREKFKQPDIYRRLRSLDKKRSFLYKIRFELSPYFQVLRWYLKKQINVLESTGISPDWRPPRIILRDHYCNKRYKKFMKKFDYYPFEKIKKFVYFPLQFQPEATIDATAPFFSNQIETARQVAMALPDDYTLVVKEHPGMVGLRPPSYIEKVARTPNVKLVDCRISSEEVLKKTDLVISPSGGTTITEAAFLRKPVIQLGDLGITKKLPNVFPHSDMTTLSAEIRKVLADDLNSPEYERKLENYVAAAYDTGFSPDYFAMWEKGKTEGLEELFDIYKREIKNALK